MTEANDRFAELTRRGHEVFTAAVQAWEQAARSLAEAARRPEGGLPDIRASVDAAFDFAARMLADQREFTKTVMSLGSQVVTATTQRAAQVIEPAAITASDDSPGTGAGPSTVESSPGAVGAGGQQATGGTVVVGVSPTRDDSADTKAPDTKAPEVRKTATKKTPAARKTAAKKTAAPTAARATAAKKTAAPAAAPAAKKTAAPAARATTAKKTTAPAAETTPAEKTPAAETPPAKTTPPAEKTPAAETPPAKKTPPAETPAPAKRSAPVQRAAGSGNGDRA